MAPLILNSVREDRYAGLGDDELSIAGVIGLNHMR